MSNLTDGKNMYAWAQNGFYNQTNVQLCSSQVDKGKSGCQKKWFGQISCHFRPFPEDFFCQFFLTPHTPLLHDDRGDRGEGFDRVTRETRVTGASKDVEGGGEAEEGVRRRRRRRRKRCHHSGTDEQRTRKDRAAKPMQWTMEGWDEQF